jgi:hypothetical protein
LSCYTATKVIEISHHLLTTPKEKLCNLALVFGQF